MILQRFFPRFPFSLLWIWIVGIALFSAPSAKSAEVKTARIPPLDVLKRAVKAWESIRDFQVALRQMESQSDGEFVEFWVKISLVKPTEDAPDLSPAFLLEFYHEPVSLETKSNLIDENATGPIPYKVYFGDASQKLYIYTPKTNSLTIQWLDETSPLPEFLKLAGFLDFDVENLKEEAYLDDEVLQETLDESETYRVKLTPRKSSRAIVPPRLIWIDRQTNLPKRFAVNAEISIQVDLGNPLINQNLKPEELVPLIPENYYRVDLTTQSPKPQIQIDIPEDINTINRSDEEDESSQ